MSHGDFVYVPESAFQTEPAPARMSAEPSKPKKPNEIAYAAASLAYRIRTESPDPATWKARIEAAPEELRECLRAYLVQAFKALKDRERRETVGKRCDAGDEAIATLAKVVGHD